MSKASWTARALISAAVLSGTLIPGCDSSSPSSASPSAAPDIRGTYAGGVAWRTTFTYPQGGATTMSEVHAYGGLLTIDGQAGSTFSGVFSISDTASGTFSGGTVNADGTVSFLLPDPAGGPHPSTDSWSEKCSLSIDSLVYTGRVDGGTLQAARNLRYSCPNAGSVSVSVSFDGRK
jgi:hypothetical protein